MWTYWHTCSFLYVASKSLIISPDGSRVFFCDMSTKTLIRSNEKHVHDSEWHSISSVNNLNMQVGYKLQLYYARWNLSNTFDVFAWGGDAYVYSFLLRSICWLRQWSVILWAPLLMSHVLCFPGMTSRACQWKSEPCNNILTSAW